MDFLLVQSTRHLNQHFFPVPHCGCVCTRLPCASSLLQVSALGLRLPWYCVSLSSLPFSVRSRSCLFVFAEAVGSVPISSSDGVALCVSIDLACQREEAASGSFSTAIADKELLLILWRCLFPTFCFLFFTFGFLHFYNEIACMWVALYLFCVRFAEPLKFVAWCLHQYWNILNSYLFKYCFYPIFSVLWGLQWHVSCAFSSCFICPSCFTLCFPCFISVYFPIDLSSFLYFR